MANLYVIRFQDGTSSAPMKVDEIKSRIQKGELKGNDKASLYPNEFSMELRDFPEFEGSWTESREESEEAEEETVKIMDEPPAEMDEFEDIELSASFLPMDFEELT
ncbi:MAG: hypothetical protein EBX52_03150 [Proteobacteria bacterium]|nr:hypothetical protein [Pseudomonadota bacterium]